MNRSTTSRIDTANFFLSVSSARPNCGGKFSLYNPAPTRPPQGSARAGTDSLTNRPGGAKNMADVSNAEFPTIIGPDASFKGELSFEKGLRLMGKFEGRITSNGRLHIAKEARMSADVESGAIIVEGEV